MNQGTRQFVIVDNLAGPRRGWGDMINDLDNASVLESLDFPEAMQRAGWHDVDVVICDMADEPLSADAAERFGRTEEQEVRHAVTDYTSIQLIERIKSEPAAPIVVAVTGHSFVFDNPILRRAIRQVKADYFVYRSELDATLVALVESGGNADDVTSELARPTADDEIPDLGVTKRTDVVSLLREISKEKYNYLFEATKLSHRMDRASEILRSCAEAAAGQLKGVNAKGQPIDSIRFTTIKKLRNLGSRIPPEYRDR